MKMRERESKNCVRGAESKGYVVLRAFQLGWEIRQRVWFLGKIEGNTLISTRNTTI